MLVMAGVHVEYAITPIAHAISMCSKHVFTQRVNVHPTGGISPSQHAAARHDKVHTVNACKADTELY